VDLLRDGGLEAHIPTLNCTNLANFPLCSSGLWRLGEDARTKSQGIEKCQPSFGKGLGKAPLLAEFEDLKSTEFSG